MTITLNRLPQTEREVNAWCDSLLTTWGALVERKGKQYAPVDKGILRASIGHEKDGDVVEAWSGADYSAPVNFGRVDGSTAPNPYWTRATEEAADEIERIARKGLTE